MQNIQIKTTLQPSKFIRRKNDLVREKEFYRANRILCVTYNEKKDQFKASYEKYEVSS